MKFALQRLVRSLTQIVCDPNGTGTTSDVHPSYPLQRIDRESGCHVITYLSNANGPVVICI